MNVSAIHRHIEILKQADLIHVEYAMHEYHITLNHENYQLYLDQLTEPYFQPKCFSASSTI